VPVDEIGYWVAGINHQAWFLQLRHRGTDLLPTSKAKLASDDLYASRTPSVIELFRRFGYFVTESSAHASEYYPYFPQDLRDDRRLGEALPATGIPVRGWQHRRGITKAKQRDGGEYEGDDCRSKAPARESSS